MVELVLLTGGKGKTNYGQLLPDIISGIVVIQGKYSPTRVGKASEEAVMKLTCIFSAPQLCLCALSFIEKTGKDAAAIQSSRREATVQPISLNC